MAQEPAERLRDVVAREVRRQIIDGEIAPGTRLREEPLAAAHGVSRVPAREALLLLEQEGFVVIAPRRGATVASRSPRRAAELQVVRQELEILAARLAARRRGGDVTAELEQVVRAGSDAAAERRFDDVLGLVERFHELVAVASGNAELVAMLESLRHRIRWMFEVDVDARSAAAWEHHRVIAEAILAGDEVAAKAAMRADVERDAVALEGLRG